MNPRALSLLSAGLSQTKIEGADPVVRAVQRAVRRQPSAHNICSHQKLLKCGQCALYAMVCMGKTRFGGTIWGEVVMMHGQKFPISMYFLRVPAYLPKGCTLH